jgi:predicted SprT family Zn-dependent metalloprotease
VIRKQQIKLSALTLIIIAVGALIYLFLWGKLFPYSSIFIGFSKHELSRTVIYVQDGAKFNDFQRIDSLLPLVEEFHQLKFLKKPRIFIFRDKESYLRRSATKARFYAYPNGSLVISPWAINEAEKGTISLEIYVRHELSHVLLYQNMGILPAYVSYPRWLLEGIAVYSTNQMGTSWYPSKEETYRLIKQGNFMPPDYYKTGKEDSVKIDAPYPIAFIYSEFGCIVDYLITTGGKEKFLSYMKTLLHNNDNDKVFRDIYGFDFDKLVVNFKESIQRSVGNK